MSSWVRIVACAANCRTSSAVTNTRVRARPERSDRPRMSRTTANTTCTASDELNRLVATEAARAAGQAGCAAAMAWLMTSRCAMSRTAAPMWTVTTTYRQLIARLTDVDTRFTPRGIASAVDAGPCRGPGADAGPPAPPRWR